QHKPVFRLFCNEAYQYAHRGTVYPYLMQVERLGGFNGDIVLQLGDRQNRDLDGVEFFEVTIPPSATEAFLPIYMPESMHINALSQSQVYAQGYAVFQDKWGDRQSVLVVSEKRCMVRSMPTVVRLVARDKQLVAKPGSVVHCALEVQRTSNFTDALEVQLVEPGAPTGIAAEPVRVEPGESVVSIAVRVPEQVAAHADWTLTFRGTGNLPGGARVVTEAAVPLKLE